jgi:2-methylcitrate dehydratase PrpD
MNRKEFLHAVAAGAAGTLAAGRDAMAGQALASSNPRKLMNDELKGATRAVVDFVTAARLDQFPPDVVAQGKRCLIDGFAVILAGSSVKGSAIIRQYIRSITDKPGASILGPERMTAPAPQAALANGASGHAMDFDDTQLSTTPDRTYGLLTHPTVPALASTLAVAEQHQASGAAFLEAFLTGFEVECKIAEAIDPQHYNRGFHSTGTAGTFAGAAATARLLKLDPARTAHAIGIAASLAAGLRVSFGSMTKPLHAGRAAENGIVAATLAAAGFTAGDDGLDGRWGYFQVMGGGAELHRLIGALGRPYAIVDPGVSVKPYPCGSLSHPSMDAMLKLVTDHDIQPAQIKAIRLRAGSNILEPLRYKTAKTELEAKFCVPFLLGVIALKRKAGVQEFTDEFVATEPIQQMMTKVTSIFDPKIEAMGFDKIRSVVEVDLVDGRTFVQPSDDRYRGSPAWPFTQAELHARFADCALPLLSNSRIQQALGQIESVEKLKDIRELTRTLTS